MPECANNAGADNPMYRTVEREYVQRKSATDGCGTIVQLWCMFRWIHRCELRDRAACLLPKDEAVLVQQPRTAIFGRSGVHMFQMRKRLHGR